MIILTVYFDPITFEKVINPETHNICTSCGKKSLVLYDDNGLGKIEPSCFECKTNSIFNDINDIF